MNITPIIEAIIALAAAVLTTVIVPYIRKRTTATQQAEISNLVKVAVTAAEQIYTGSGRGAEKKAYVLAWLQTNGVIVDGERLDALVESAVYALKNGEV